MNGNPRFHEGELEVQRRAGEEAMAKRTAAVLRDALTPAMAAFASEQRFAALAVVDGEGAVWSAIGCGAPGFVRAPGPVTIAIDGSAFAPAAPIAALVPGALAGMIVIDFAARRRLRVNGAIASAAGAIEIDVREAYPNCPKYITRRSPRVDAVEGAPIARGVALDDERRALLARADTAFVASVHPARGADASHRGGAPGFVAALDARTVRVPEYAGNGLFNSLGNFAVDPRAGLTIVDFERGRLLALTGASRVVIDPRDKTRRFWDLAIAAWVDAALPGGLRWDLDECPRR